MIVLPDTLPALNVAIVRRAQQDIPILENPVGSNRSPEIDAMCKRWGTPLASYWCALWAATVWADAGADVPPAILAKDWHPAICETWHQWAMLEGLFTSIPVIGGAVLYGDRGRGPANHIGACIVSTTPLRMDLEGNASLTGTDNNGELTALRQVDMTRVIGYVQPRPRARAA